MRTSQVLLGMTIKVSCDVQFPADKELLMPRETHVPMTGSSEVPLSQGTEVSKRHVGKQCSHLSF